MIPVCMADNVSLTNSDGLEARLLACDPARPVPERIYLVMEELLAIMRRDCANAGIPAPAVVGIEGFDLPVPRPLAGFWRKPRPAAGRVRVCLINGGGGGIGDGIMMAPALAAARELMAAASGGEVEFDVYSSTPARTDAALAGLAGVRVRSLPLSLAEFSSYQWFADLSGMLRDPDFSRMHLTDYTLARLGIAPEMVDAAAKEPRLRLAPIDAGLGRELLGLRRRAGDRPLVALVFTASRTRALPEDMAAELFRLLARWALPVALTADARAAAEFVEKHGLAGMVADLSPLSRDYQAYFSIVAALDCVVSVDTSAVHVAGALRRPVVALFNSIDHRLRTRYYRTVLPVQVEYRGRRCSAPCGLSKMRYLFSAPDGAPLFDIGYACPEALDLEGIEAGMREMLAAGGEPAAIKARFAPRFQASRAPCWRNLDLGMVADAAMQICKGRRAPRPAPAAMEN